MKFVKKFLKENVKLNHVGLPVESIMWERVGSGRRSCCLLFGLLCHKGNGNGSSAVGTSTVMVSVISAADVTEIL